MYTYTNSFLCLNLLFFKYGQELVALFNTLSKFSRAIQAIPRLSQEYLEFQRTYKSDILNEQVCLSHPSRGNQKRDRGTGSGSMLCCNRQHTHPRYTVFFLFLVLRLSSLKQIFAGTLMPVLSRLAEHNYWS